MLGLYLSDFKCNLDYIYAVNVKFLRNFTTLDLRRLMSLGGTPQTKHRSLFYRCRGMSPNHIRQLMN